MSTPPWLAAARQRADQPPLRERVPLGIGGTVCASIEPALGERLVGAGLPLQLAAGVWQIDAPAQATLAQVAAWLHREGLSGRWRDELLDVSDERNRVLATVERAAVRALGITTHAVHLIGLASGGRVWVQKRALDKATDAGLWDTLMGGQVATGETAETTLARETLEEAGLDVAVLIDVRRGERIGVRRPVAEGYMVETIDVFTATVPEGVEPRNLDGEVDSFDCLDPGELRAWLAAGRFTLEATLILGAWFETQVARG